MYGKIERILQFAKALPFQLLEVITCSYWATTPEPLHGQYQGGAIFFTIIYA
jgi:hypothetical protein